jgi:hypothetical protein
MGLAVLTCKTVARPAPGGRAPAIRYGRARDGSANGGDDGNQQGLDLQVNFTTLRLNDKIHRIHLALGETNPPSTAPYRFTEGDR